MRLEEHIRDHEGVGSKQVPLGIQKMPEGYALMQSEDGQYYWLREDGEHSVMSWDKWAAYRGSKKDKEKP